LDLSTPFLDLIHRKGLIMLTLSLRKIAFSWTLMAAIPVAVGCGYDGMMSNPFSESYPGAVGVAIATSNAYDKQTLQALPAINPSIGFLRTNRYLQDFRNRLETQAQFKKDNSLAILLVDTGLWSRYRHSEGSLIVEPHIASANPNELVVVASEASFAALLSGELPVETALKDGLLVVNQAGFEPIIKAAFTTKAS
jgi:hypothetical protein